MRVIIACEYSGRVRNAMRNLGIDAYSCDLLPDEGGDEERHYQGDIFEVLKHYPLWDMLIGFPPCTHLSSAGAVYWPQKQKDGRQNEAINFVKRLMWEDGSRIPRVAIENPVGILSTVWRKPDQIIEPFHFGEPIRKRTCLWLRNLPLLEPTKIVQPIGSLHSGGRYGGRRKDGTRKISPRAGTEKRCPKERSLTFQGVAAAMAAQWGKLDQYNPINT